MYNHCLRVITSRASFSTTTVSLKKVAKENVIKKYNKENKLLFGALLETQTQRKKRLAKEGILPLGIVGSKADLVSHDDIIALDPNEIEAALNTCNTESLKDTKDKIANDNDDGQSSQVISDYSSVSLADILKNPFPLENPAKSLIQHSSSDDSILNPVKQDRSHGYFPSVTSILSATMSPLARRALERWRKNKIAALGMDGFLALNKATLQKGRDFHNAIQQVLTDRQSQQDMELSDDIRNCLKSAEHILNQISKVHLLEAEVVHGVLQYRGYVDCICDMGESSNVAIEWKKSDSKKSTIDKTYDAPLQVAAYMGAVNYDDSYKLQVTSGVVVVVYEDGSPASVFPVVADYWQHWYRRYQMFHALEDKENFVQE